MILHITTSVGAVGAVAAFLALASVGLSREPRVPGATYPAMEVITNLVILPLISLSLVLGILQAVFTPCGLFRQRWIVWKLGLTLSALVILILKLPTIAALAQAARDLAPIALDQQREMVIHAAGGLAVLGAAVVLSVYKPVGRAQVRAKVSATS